MNQITKLLKEGDLRTKGKSEEVVKQVLARPGLLGQVVDAILHADPGVRLRAADAAEKISRINPASLNPFKKIFLDAIAEIKQQEVRWHTAQILPRLELSGPERRTVVSLMKRYLSDDSRIVKTFAMQALADIALQDRSYLPEATKIIEKLTANGSPAMKARGRMLMMQLKKAKDR